MRNKGQTTIEYLLVIVVIVVVLTTIAPVVKKVVPRAIAVLQGTGR